VFREIRNETSFAGNPNLASFDTDITYIVKKLTSYKEKDLCARGQWAQKYFFAFPILLDGIASIPFVNAKKVENRLTLFSRLLCIDCCIHSVAVRYAFALEYFSHRTFIRKHSFMYFVQ
jgi:hypothetical protein